jgi:diguanylate cyclase (GGDEF)-like protein
MTTSSEQTTGTCSEAEHTETDAITALTDGYRRLADVLHALVSEQSADAILARIATDLRNVVPCDDVVIWELRDNTLAVTLVDGDDQAQMCALRIPVGDGITGKAVERQTIFTADARVNPRAGRVPGTRPRSEAIACFPLTARGTPLGALSIYRRGAKSLFSAYEVELAAHFADVAAVALHNANTLAELQRLAATDDLTGLANRRQFYKELGRHIANARRHNIPLSLLLLDLNKFKQVNDRHGHQQGDRALRTVAQAIKSRLRAGDLSARLGGDEFAVVLPHTPYAEALALSIELQASIEASIETTTPLSVSIGAASYAGGSVDELISSADAHLYQTKKVQDPGAARQAPTTAAA